MHAHDPHPSLHFVRRRQDHRHRLGVDGAHFGVRLRRQEGIDVVGGLALLDLPDRSPVGPVGPDAGEAGEGAGLVERKPDVAAFGLVNSLNELNGTTQRFSAPSHRVQCLLFTLRMLVVPPSGSIRSNSLKSTGLPLAWSFSARFFVASISAFDDDGMPKRAVASSRPSTPLRTIGAL
jgi:hypothetical protein